MAGKKPSITEILNLLEKQFGSAPVLEERDDPLTDQLLVAVLADFAGVDGAKKIVRSLSEQFLDFNEARVSPLFELEEVLAPHVEEARRREAATHLRMTMQDVWDGSHGQDLEPLRDADPAQQREFLKHLPNIPGGAAALIFQLATGDKRLAFGPGEEHLLKRLGMLPRSTTPERIRLAVERKVKPADRVKFAWLFGNAAHLFEVDFDAKHPFCKLLVRVNARELVVREQERKREEARQKAEKRQRKIDEERQRKAEERERILAEKSEAKRQHKLEMEKRKAAAIAKKKADAVKKKADAVAKKKAAVAKRKSDALKKKAAAAKKKVAAAKKKVAVSKKKAAAAKKKAIASKKTAPAKKKAAPQKKAVKKKAAKKKAVQKKVAKKKAAPKKKAAKKKVAKKKAIPAKKKTAKKAAKKKAAKKKAAPKKTRRPRKR